MLTLPAELLPLIVEFTPLFSKIVWEHAKVLLAGAILARGKRTVTVCLRVMGKSQEVHFQNYHRVLNRARWSALATSQILLRLLVSTFAPKSAGRQILAAHTLSKCKKGAGVVSATGSAAPEVAVLIQTRLMPRVFILR
jgi:hypothetical protein